LGVGLGIFWSCDFLICSQNEIFGQSFGHSWRWAFPLKTRRAPREGLQLLSLTGRLKVIINEFIYHRAPPNYVCGLNS
jgi:hypothetical protein